jgi:hypothetical protein
MTQDSQPAGSGKRHPATWEPEGARLHHAVVGDPKHETNQAERAAMHPEGDDDLEWHYYHGAWSG